MTHGTKIAGALLLSAALQVHGQTGAAAAPARSKSKHKNQQQILMEQLNEKFEKIDQLTQKYDALQHQVEDMRKQLQARDAELQQTRTAASAAQAAVLAVQQQPAAAPAAAVVTLQAKVDDLATQSTTLAQTVKTDEQVTHALAEGTTIHFHGVDLIPGGFLAAETVSRQRGVGADINTPFTSVPFSGQTAGTLSEFNASGRQSRLAMMVEGKLPSATLRGYYEGDFLSAGTTSNGNVSNSYTFRQRQVWAQAALQNGFTLTGGQMWSLATEYKSGLTNTSEAIPMTIDAQYNVGFTWERQYGFRVVKQVGSKFWLGASVEAPQTLNIGGHNLPTIVYQQAGNGGGLYNSTANYSFNYAPDLIAKAVYENKWGHYEVFGVGRFFRDRIFPNAQSTTPSALGAYTAKTQGGGVGANATVSLFNKKLDVGAHVLAGDGIGRYSSSTLPDATAHPDGSLELLAGGSALGKVEWHATPRLDLYSYYGGEYAKRAFYATGLFATTPGPTFGQPILGGYGAPTNPVYGCSTEVLPVTSTNGGALVPGSAANCQADNRNLQEGTFGYWFRFYRGSRGSLQQGIQYSYVERHTWQGIGAPGGSGSPKAIDNMWFTSFRYYLPK